MAKAKLGQARSGSKGKHQGSLILIKEKNELLQAAEAFPQSHDRDLSQEAAAFLITKAKQEQNIYGSAP